MSSGATSPRGQGVTLRGRTARGIGAVALLILCSAPVFLLGMRELEAQWMTPAYSHGPAMLAMAFWLALRSLAAGPATPDAPAVVRWPGIVLIAVGLLLGALGTRGGIPDVSAYGLMIWIAGLVAFGVGWASARGLQMPLLLLALSVPLPQFLHWQATSALQSLASDLSVPIIRAFGIPVRLEGHIIDLGDYQLEVAQACSGLQYLFPVAGFAVLFAALSRQPAWQRIALVAFSVPLAIVMNALRIAITALLVDRAGIEAAEGFLHAFEGWAIMLACLLGLLLFMVALRALTPASARRGPLLDLRLPHLGDAATGALAATTPSQPLALAAAGALVSALTFSALAPERSMPPRLNFYQFARQIEGWQGVPRGIAPEMDALLRADDYLDLTFYANDAAAPVQMFSVFYVRQTAGSAIHSPELCLPVNGWEVLEIGRRQLDMSAAGFGSFEAVRVIVTRNGEKQLVYYWFEQRGKREISELRTKLGILLDGLRTGRSDGALVRYVTPITGKDGLAAAEERVQSFMRASLPELPGFVPM